MLSASEAATLEMIVFNAFCSSDALYCKLATPQARRGELLYNRLRAGFRSQWCTTRKRRGRS